jgi:flagellar M-ring protein FliF
MDFLNTAFAQLSDLFRSMTVGARITAALLLIVVVVSLAWLFQHQVYGGDTFLLGGQSFAGSDMNAIEMAFAQAGLNDYEWVGMQVRIPRSKQYAYVAALADAKALPADWSRFLSQALDSSNPFFSTGAEREMRMQVAKQEKLALVIKSMQDVADAAVQYDSQKKGGFSTQRLATASVMIKMKGSRSLEEDRVQMLRGMVAGCFAGLQPEKVTVSDLTSGRVYSVSEGLGGSGSNHQYFTTKEEARKHYQKQILEVLAYVPGVTVAVNAELEKDLHTTVHSTKHDPKTTNIELHEESQTTKTESAAPGGPPGLTTQQPPQLNQGARVSAAAKGSTSEEERSSRDERNVVNTESTEIASIGLTPRRVTVSVGVPSTYFEDVWRRRNPTPDGQPPQKPDDKALANIIDEETKRIQNAVVPLIPKVANEIDPTPQVTVTPFFVSPAKEIPPPAASATALRWLSDHWQTLGLVGLVLASLLMVRSIVRAAPPEVRALDLPLPPVTVAIGTQQAKSEAAPETAKARLKRKSSGGKSLRDELTEMVREDPDTAANILRGWIGTGN